MSMTKRRPSSMLVDSHCHLDFKDFSDDLDGVIERAAAAGVGTMVSISTHLSRFEGVRAVAERFERVWCSVGVHPHEAGREGLSSAIGREWGRERGGRYGSDVGGGV